MQALIETQAGLTIPVPKALEQLLRNAPPDGELLTPVEFGWTPDMWISYGPVEPHTDGTADGLVTYGAVLLNDADYTMVHGGVSYDLSPGTLYCMDGRIEHEARARSSARGLFAVLIWDWPPVWTLEDFRTELLRDPRWSATLCGDGEGCS